MPQPRTSSTPRIVVIRRRAPVTLHTATGPDAAAGVEVFADGQLIARIAADPEMAPAMAGLLRGPAWLFLVAARLPVQIVGRLWVMVPAQPPTADAPELHDEDPVYAYPIAELARPAVGADAGDDLTAQAGRLLELATLLPAASNADPSG